MRFIPDEFENCEFDDDPSIWCGGGVSEEEEWPLFNEDDAPRFDNWCACCIDDENGGDPCGVVPLTFSDC